VLFPHSLHSSPISSECHEDFSLDNVIFRTSAFSFEVSERFLRDPFQEMLVKIYQANVYFRDGAQKYEFGRVCSDSLQTVRREGMIH